MTQKELNENNFKKYTHTENTKCDKTKSPAQAPLMSSNRETGWAHSTALGRTNR